MPMISMPVQDALPRVRRRRRPDAVQALCLAILLLLAVRPFVQGFLDGAATQAWATIFVAICLQALPFLVLGVLVSGAITAFVPASTFQRLLPRNKALSVPVAGAAGLLLPGCECGSVPVAGGLMSRGVPTSSALTFLLAAPAINPIVLVATAVAFPAQPEIVLGRFVASLLAAVIMGWLWIRLGKEDWIRRRVRKHAHGETSVQVFRATAKHDFLHAGGFLVLGGVMAATLNVTVPRDLYASVAENPVLAVLALSTLAVVLAICSEADAFVAASLTEFSTTALLAFMVVGPMVDVKLVALQSGTFGRAFAFRFAPVTLVVAILSAVLVGAVLL